MSALRRVLTLFLAVVGLIAILEALITGIIPDLRPSRFPIGETTVDARSSPDGELKVFVVTRAGGGGLSPYCTVGIYVGSSRAQAADVADREHSAFEGDCVSIQDKDAVFWTANRRLRIQIGLLSGAMIFRARISPAQVDVDFVVRHDPSSSNEAQGR